jgi:hypothetical protein
MDQEFGITVGFKCGQIALFILTTTSKNFNRLESAINT